MRTEASLKKRNPAADIIRCFALFTVVAVHFFKNNGYYNYTVVGGRMYIMTLMRSFFIICVPLFLILSGFLSRKKTPSVNYFKKIFSILLTYVLASFACAAYSAFVLKQDWNLITLAGRILNYTAAPYAWYIEMYIGLFLLIPFINLAYNNIPSQKWKLGFIAVLIFVTSVPSIINVYSFTTPGWWATPSISNSANQILPQYWLDFYPITYYVIGCYLGEYGLKLKKSINLLLIALSVFVSGTYYYWRSYGVNYIWGAWGSYYSLFTLITAVLVFVFINNLNYDKFPQKLAFFFSKVSGACLGGYLVSWIFDQAFYPILAEKVPFVPDRLESFVIMVPVVYVCSLLLSYALSKLQWVIEKIFGTLTNKLKKEKNEI